MILALCMAEDMIRSGELGNARVYLAAALADARSRGASKAIRLITKALKALEAPACQ